MLLWLIMVKALFHIEYACVYLISYCKTYTLITLPSDFECSICNDVKEETLIIQLKCSHCK